MLCETLLNSKRIIPSGESQGLVGDLLGPNEIIDLVELKTRNLEQFLDSEDRMQEIREGLINQQRKENGFYSRSLMIQQKQDEIFSEFAPASFRAITDRIDSADVRWKKTVQISRKIGDFLREKGIDTSIIDCRAKSVFSIWRKMKNYDLDIDEVYDTNGIRVVADDIQQAYEIAYQLMTRFNLVTEERFRRSKAKHQSIRDNLLNPNQRWYGAIHLTCFDDNDEFDRALKNPVGINFKKIERDIFDIQITTRDSFINMVQRRIEHPYAPSHLRSKSDKEKRAGEHPFWHVASRKVMDILGFEHWVEAYESWETGLPKRIYRICTGKTIESGISISPEFVSIKDLFRFVQKLKQDQNLN